MSSGAASPMIDVNMEVGLGLYILHSTLSFGRLYIHIKSFFALSGISPALLQLPLWSDSRGSLPFCLVLLFPCSGVKHNCRSSEIHRRFETSDLFVTFCVDIGEDCVLSLRFSYERLFHLPQVERLTYWRYPLR